MQTHLRRIKKHSNSIQRTRVSPWPLRKTSPLSKNDSDNIWWHPFTKSNSEARGPGPKEVGGSDHFLRQSHILLSLEAEYLLPSEWYWPLNG